MGAVVYGRCRLLAALQLSFLLLGITMQVNTTTYVEITIHQEQLREDDNSIGGVLLRLTPAEARQLARELNEATRKGKK